MAEQPKLSATFKAHGGYDAPWLVVEGADPADLALRLQSIEQHGLPALVNGVDEAFKALFAVAPVTGQHQPAPAAPANPYAAPAAPAPAAPAAPAAAPAGAPQGPAPQCNHGARVYSEWDNKDKTKHFKAWKCPNDTGRNATDKCVPQWVN